MKPKLVIFDCDGVLIDSEIVVHEVGSRELTRRGFPMTVERAIELFSGVAEEELHDIVLKEFDGISDDVFNQVLQKIKSAFPEEVKPIKDIKKVLNYLDDNSFNRCIASNGLYDDIIECLAFTDIISYFDKNKIFSVSTIKPGKPEPDLFLHAAKKFRAKPQECIVIEDSVVGIRAAKAANMPVVGFLGASHTKSPWYVDSILNAKPDVVVNDANELLEILK